jgi:hypothetical protein
MKASKEFSNIFFGPKPLLSADEGQAFKARIFLPDGSADASVDAYSLQPSQQPAGHGSNLSRHDVATYVPIRSDERSWSTSIVLDAIATVAVPQSSTVSENALPLTVLDTADSLRAFAERPGQSHVYFARQRNSYSVLSISPSLYNIIATTRQLAPAFLGYLQNLGERDSEIEIIPQAPRFRLRRTTISGKDAVSLESMFGVRFVELHGRSDQAVRSNPSARWSIRQSAMYLRGTDGEDTATCLFVTPSKSLKACLGSYLPRFSCLSTACVIELQALILDSSIRSWRPYIVALTTETDGHAANVLGAMPDDSGPMNMSNAGERQSLMILDEKIQNALSALRHTEQLLEAMSDEYAKLSTQGEDFISEEVLATFREMLRETTILVLRLEALQTRLQGVASIVSSFLELSSGFALRQLTLESRHENEAMRQLSERMHRLTEKATQDAAAVKVLTIMTMIYLPATVVSNFFSTSFVSTVGNDHIVVLSDWWIFIATSVPLTLITLYIWLVWMRIQAYQLYPWWWILKKGIVATKGQSVAPDEESRFEAPRVKQA